MKYFRNTELAKLHHVSEKSVRNWIDAARAGKTGLQLHEHNGKFFIANTTKNSQVVEELVQKGKKFRNSRGFRAISPNDEFYKVFSPEQILDIVSNLSIHHELPVQYTYIDGGADYWDDYANRMVKDEASNVLKKTIELIDKTFSNIDDLIGGRKVNIIDLGPGNGLPVRDLIGRMLKQDRMGRYIALDCSKEMLDILEHNMNQWFKDKVSFEGHIRDFTNERFDDLTVPDYSGNDPAAPVNIVLLLGGTLANFRRPDRVLQLISASMGPNDLLIYSGFLDTPKTRRYFDFDVSGSSQKLTPKHRLILNYLNIDESLYYAERKFDENLRARSISFIPSVDISVDIKVADRIHRIDMKKGEPILIWRHWHKSAVDIINQFDQNEFDVMQSTKSSDNQYLLVTAKIKHA